MSTTYTVVITELSLERGRVGEQIGEPERIEFGDPYAALRALYDAIEVEVGKGHRRLQLEMPDGRRLAFDPAFEEITGDPPRYNSRGQIFGYPGVFKGEGRDAAERRAGDAGQVKRVGPAGIAPRSRSAAWRTARGLD